MRAAPVQLPEEETAHAKALGGAEPRVFLKPSAVWATRWWVAREHGVILR